MKKLLGILVLGLLLSGNAYSEDKSIICTYEKVLNKTYPCDQSVYLKQTLDSMFFDLTPKPKEVSVDDFKKLINKRIQEWDAGADQRNKEYEADRKNEIDLKCEILAGRANNSSSAKKIYKKCMKAEGY